MTNKIQIKQGGYADVSQGSIDESKKTEVSHTIKGAIKSIPYDVDHPSVDGTPKILDADLKGKNLKKNLSQIGGPNILGLRQADEKAADDQLETLTDHQPGGGIHQVS